MSVLIGRIELCRFHTYIFITMLASPCYTYHCDSFHEYWSRSPSVHHTTQQLKEILEDGKETDNGARVVVEQRQQNVFRSLGASGSVWELLDQYPRVVKSQSLLDQCSGLQVCQGAPGSAGDKFGSVDRKPVSTWQRRWQPRQCWPQTWEHVKSL